MDAQVALMGTIQSLRINALDVLRQVAYVLVNNQVVAVAVCLGIISINQGA
jgi:hypothetical protein